MPSVAEQLRRAREAQGLSLHDLAELTKLRSDYLDALEHANYDPFPAPVYIRGSVRNCASHLKLDVSAVLADLDAELADSPEFSEPPSLTGQHRGPLDWLTYQLSRANWIRAAWAALLLLVVLGGLWLWRTWSQRGTEDPLKRLGPGMYQPARPIAESDLLPLPTNAATPAP
jgi:cytoskeletal protein RodZ